jgi:hypothetical protein
MGLLNFSDGLLGVLRNAQDPSPTATPTTIPGANGLPWAFRQQNRLPLSLAGPAAAGLLDSQENPLQPVQLKCDGWQGCTNGGSFGYGGMYRFGNKILCESCAAKKTGVELSPAAERIEVLTPFLLGGDK